ncbi:MAG: hypothetical protein HND48_05320 [Chloroflexi bacterium]|nr:hypothetical protein [Chloroflexota bacterium]
MGNGSAKLKAAAKAVLPLQRRRRWAEALVKHVLKPDEPKPSAAKSKKKGSD